MAKTGNSGLSSKRGGFENSYSSSFGFSNVGAMKTERLMGGIASRGTVEPSVGNVQEYLDTGKFDNYGTAGAAKKKIVSQIVSDMMNRGYDVGTSENGLMVLIGEKKTPVQLSYSRKTTVGSQRSLVHLGPRGRAA